MHELISSYCCDILNITVYRVEMVGLRLFRKKGLLVILLTALAALLLASPVSASEFMYGSGTEGDPYVISNKTHLYNVRNHPDAHFELIADITFTADDFAADGLFYNDGIGWQSIPAFSGVFDGGGHTISGLTCKLAITDSGLAGLFGRNEGTIRAVNLTNGSWTVSKPRTTTSLPPSVYIGGIAAQNEGVIENCAADGTVYVRGFNDNGVDSYLGGIAGVNTGMVRACTSTSLVQVSYGAGNSKESKNTKYIGGISGKNAGTISGCSNSGRIEQGQYAGGITGINTQTVENCFNTGTVCAIGYSADEISFSGGICGSNSGTVHACYNAGRTVDSVGDPCIADNTGNASACYYFERAVDCTDCTDSLEGLSVEQMKTQQTFVGFDFDAVWTFDPSSGYPFPVLKGAPPADIPEYDADCFDGGSGLLWDPYQISTAAQFSAIRQYPDACYLLTGRLTLKNGEYGQGYDFYGCFDGGGNEIVITEPSYAYKAGASYFNTNQRSCSLFYSNYGFICNVKLSVDLQVTIAMDPNDFNGSYRPTHIAGIALINWGSGVIQDCLVSGKFYIKGVSAHIGGIADISYGKITDCINKSSIKTDAMSATAGGIVNYGKGGRIINCENRGRITVSTDRNGTSLFETAGGIVGDNKLTSVFRCTNSGDITAVAKIHREYGYGYSGIELKVWAGGIVGEWGYAGSSGRYVIADCSNSGRIEARTDEGYLSDSVDMTAAFCGGICGSAGYEMTNHVLEENAVCNITRCRNSGDTTSSSSSGSVNYEGGIVGACTGEITDCWNSGDTDCAITPYPKNAARCYNTGNTVWGLFRSFVDSKKKLLARNCYDAGQKGSRSQGFSPSTEYTVHASAHCYFLKGTAVQKHTDVYTEEEMRMQSTYEALGFDFEKIWVMLPGEYPYPQLRSNLATPVRSIAVAQQPSEPIVCIEGIFLNYNGMKLKIVYEDGTQSIVEPWPECFSLLDTKTKGVQNIPLTVLDCKTADTVPVLVRDKGLASIQMKTQPEKTRYDKDAVTVDLTGAEIQLTYDNGATETAAVTDDMVSGFIPGQVGTQMLTVTYQGAVCTFEITVYSVEQIRIITLPVKTDYVQGQPFSAEGGVLEVIFTDGVTEEHPLSDAQLVYDPAAVGSVSVAAAYAGKTTTFTVTMRERKAKSISLLKEPEKLAYALFEELDFTGSRLKVVFESTDDYTEDLILTSEMVSGYCSSAIGYQTLTVQYCGKETTYVVTVLDPVRSAALTTSESGAVSVRMELRLAQQIHVTIAIGAYRDGQLAAVSLVPAENGVITVALPGSSETDKFVLFLLDDANRPLRARQELTAAK